MSYQARQRPGEAVAGEGSDYPMESCDGGMVEGTTARSPESRAASQPNTNEESHNAATSSSNLSETLRRERDDMHHDVESGPKRPRLDISMDDHASGDLSSGDSSSSTSSGSSESSSDVDAGVLSMSGAGAGGFDDIWYLSDMVQECVDTHLHENGVAELYSIPRVAAMANVLFKTGLIPGLTSRWRGGSN